MVPATRSIITLFAAMMTIIVIGVLVLVICASLIESYTKKAKKSHENVIMTRRFGEIIQEATRHSRSQINPSNIELAVLYNKDPQQQQHEVIALIQPVARNRMEYSDEFAPIFSDTASRKRD